MRGTATRSGSTAGGRNEELESSSDIGGGQTTDGGDGSQALDGAVVVSSRVVAVTGAWGGEAVTSLAAAAVSARRTDGPGVGRPPPTALRTALARPRPPRRARTVEDAERGV